MPPHLWERVLFDMEKSAREAITAPGKFVDVGEGQLHLFGMGTELAQNTLPTVIIEAGRGFFSPMYHWLQSGLSKYLHVYTYDRSGLGWSSPNTVLPDAEKRAQELFALLKKANLNGPFVFVGHSIAGLYLRVFADKYSEKVKGLVFLDPSHPLQSNILKTRTPLYKRFHDVWSTIKMTMTAEASGLNTSVSPWCSLPADIKCQIQYLSKQPSTALTDRAEGSAFLLSCKQAHACGDLGDLPLLVVTGGIRTLEECLYLPDPESFMEQWLLLQRDLVALSSNGGHRIIEGAGHCSLVTEKEHADHVVKEILEFVGSL